METAMQPSVPPTETPKPWLKWVLIVVAVTLLSSGATYVVLTSQQTQQQPAPTPLPAEVSTKEGDETTNWKTYTNTKVGYLIKYPIDITLDETIEDAVSFYRKDVPHIGGGMGRCCGMTIYRRAYESDPWSNTRVLVETSISTYQAVKIKDERTCAEDAWVKNPNKKNAIEISLTTCAEKPPYQQTDFEIFNQILSTFKFLE